jgi:hypothetical protein
LRVKQTNIGGLFSIALTAFLCIACIIYTVSTGIGTWGLNKQSVRISQTSFGGLVSVTLFNFAVLLYSVSDGGWRLTVLLKQ